MGSGGEGHPITAPPGCRRPFGGGPHLPPQNGTPKKDAGLAPGIRLFHSTQKAFQRNPNFFIR